MQGENKNMLTKLRNFKKIAIEMNRKEKAIYV